MVGLQLNVNLLSILAYFSQNLTFYHHCCNLLYYCPMFCGDICNFRATTLPPAPPSTITTQLHDYHSLPTSTIRHTHVHGLIFCYCKEVSVTNISDISSYRLQMVSLQLKVDLPTKPIEFEYFFFQKCDPMILELPPLILQPTPTSNPTTITPTTTHPPIFALVHSPSPLPTTHHHHTSTTIQQHPFTCHLSPIFYPLPAKPPLLHYS